MLQKVRGIEIRSSNKEIDILTLQAAVHPPPLSKKERMALFKNCQEFLPDKDYPNGWFHAPGMKRDNIRVRVHKPVLLGGD